MQGEPNKLMVYEVYSDEAAFQAHRTGASLKRVRQEVQGMLVSNTFVRCTLLE